MNSVAFYDCKNIKVNNKLIWFVFIIDWIIFNLIFFKDSDIWSVL